jgi:hypothetical protein
MFLWQIFCPYGLRGHFCVIWCHSQACNGLVCTPFHYTWWGAIILHSLQFIPHLLKTTCWVNLNLMLNKIIFVLTVCIVSDTKYFIQNTNDITILLYLYTVWHLIELNCHNKYKHNLLFSRHENSCQHINSVKEPPQICTLWTQLYSFPCSLTVLHSLS